MRDKIEETKELKKVTLRSYICFYKDPNVVEKVRWVDTAFVFQPKHHFVKQKLFSYRNIMCKNSEKVINYLMFPSQLLKR